MSSQLVNYIVNMAAVFCLSPPPDMRGFMTQHGLPDCPRSARYILKDYVSVCGSHSYTDNIVWTFRSTHNTWMKLLAPLNKDDQLSTSKYISQYSPWKRPQNRVKKTYAIWLAHMVVKYVLYMPHACRVTHDETTLMHAHMGGEELGLVRIVWI